MPPRSRSQRSAQFASFSRSLPSLAALPVSGLTRFAIMWRCGWSLSRCATISAWWRSSPSALSVSSAARFISARSGRSSLPQLSV